MITTVELTVGDTGVTLKFTLSGGGLTTLANCTATLSCPRVDPDDPQLRRIGGTLFSNRALSITDAANLKAEYHLASGDVAKVGAGVLRIAVTLPSNGGVVNFPGPLDQQIVLKFNAA